LPPDIIEERVIRFQEIHGKILYTFRGDGTVQAVAQTVQATAAVDAGAIDVDLVVSLTGKGTAQYQVDGNPGSMRMHDPDVDQFNLSVSLGGVSILQDISIQDLVWFGMKNNESPALPYECRDSTLSLTVPPLHEGDPSATVILVRN